MNFNKIFSLMAICMALTTIGCKSTTNEAEVKTDEAAAMTDSKPDMSAIKAEIQALNNDWAMASNARNAAAILAFYAEDAISMPANKPTLTGKAAIQKDSETWFDKSKEGSTVSFETKEVFGDGQLVTEIGTVTTKDASGKVIYTGKYMSLWEKRDGKWICIRDISNDDVKEK